MSDASHPKAAARWRWVATIVVIVAVNVLLLGMQSGQCVDYRVESGLESTCTVAPSIGWPAMWAVGIASILAIGYCAYRIAQQSGSQN